MEAMVAILLLGVAILPMAKMFDAGLRASDTGAGYDKARTLANQNLEQVKALPYLNKTPAADTVVERYPPGPSAPCPSAAPDFVCGVQTRYVDRNFANPVILPQRLQMRVEVTVTWRGDRTYKTSGYVTGG